MVLDYTTVFREKLIEKMGNDGFIISTDTFEHIIQNATRIFELLESIERENFNNKKFIKRLMNTDFLYAPASTKHHGSTWGGLAEHSLKVHEVFSMLIERYMIDIDKNTQIIVSLLHDMCKIYSYEPNILQRASQGRKKGEISLSKPFAWCDTFPFGHGEKSVVYLMEMGLPLTEQEKVLIRFHMGLYDSEYRNTLTQNSVNSFYPEVKLLFCADYIASYLEDME